MVGDLVERRRMVERRLAVIAIIIITGSLASLGMTRAIFGGPSLDDLRRAARSWSFVGAPRPA
jgi:hypothetical protein